MGGMAEIFRARTATEGFSKRVCIKRVLPNFLEDAEFVTMFRDEAKTAAKLQHGNVVQVFDFGEVEEDSGATLYLAMEFVDGADLRRVAEASRKKGLPLSFGEVVQLGVDACRGLHHAHSLVEDGRPLGIVHRDVSPHNILVSRSGEVKVADFGIARAAERATHTSTGIVKGKVGYMSPEQAEGRAFDHRLDQWALGVVLWELLCGARLFAGDNDVSILRRILAHDVPPPSSLRRDLAPALEAIVLRALAFDPAHRFPDLRAMEQALQRFLFSGALDPATADVRALFPRIVDAASGAPQPLRSTQVASADAVLSPSLVAAAPATVLGEADDGDLLPSTEADGSATASVVFTNSGGALAAPSNIGAPAGRAVATTVALPDPRAAVDDALPVVARGAAGEPRSGPTPRTGSRAGAALTALEDGALIAEVNRLLFDQDGTPVTRTAVSAAAAPPGAAPSWSPQPDAAPPSPPTPTGATAVARPRPARRGLVAVGAGVIAVGALAVGGSQVMSSSSRTSAGHDDGRAGASLVTPATSSTGALTVASAGAPALAVAATPSAAATVPSAASTAALPSPAAAAAAAALPAAPPPAASPAGSTATTTAAVGTVYVEIVGGWGQVSSGGRLLGETPLQLRLPAGRQTLTLREGETGQTRSVVVTVPAGGRVSVRESF